RLPALGSKKAHHQADAALYSCSRIRRDLGPENDGHFFPRLSRSGLIKPADTDTLAEDKDTSQHQQAFPLPASVCDVCSYFHDISVLIGCRVFFQDVLIGIFSTARAEIKLDLPFPVRNREKKRHFNFRRPSVWLKGNSKGVSRIVERPGPVLADNKRQGTGTQDISGTVFVESDFELTTRLLGNIGPVAGHLHDFPFPGNAFFGLLKIKLFRFAGCKKGDQHNPDHTENHVVSFHHLTT